MSACSAFELAQCRTTSDVYTLLRSSPALKNNVSVFDHKGWTALHYAADSGRADSVDALLRAGADKAAAAWSDRLGKPLDSPVTPVDVAREAHNRGHDRAAVLAVLDDHSEPIPGVTVKVSVSAGQLERLPARVAVIEAEVVELKAGLGKLGHEMASFKTSMSSEIDAIRVAVADLCFAVQHCTISSTADVHKLARPAANSRMESHQLEQPRQQLNHSPAIQSEHKHLNAASHPQKQLQQWAERTELTADAAAASVAEESIHFDDSYSFDPDHESSTGNVAREIPSETINVDESEVLENIGGDRTDNLVEGSLDKSEDEMYQDAMDGFESDSAQTGVEAGSEINESVTTLSAALEHQDAQDNDSKCQGAVDESLSGNRSTGVEALDESLAQVSELLEDYVAGSLASDPSGNPTLGHYAGASDIDDDVGYMNDSFASASNASNTADGTQSSQQGREQAATATAVDDLSVVEVPSLIQDDSGSFGTDQPGTQSTSSVPGISAQVRFQVQDTVDTSKSDANVSYSEDPFEQSSDTAEINESIDDASFVST